MLDIDGADQLLMYFVLSSLAWVVVILLLRVVVFAKSKVSPVFRITPDRRDVRDMKTCNWLQVIIDKWYELLLGEIGEDEAKRWVQERVNRIMHLSGGKFELIELRMGSAPPQICGVECSTEGPHRVALYTDVFYQGGFTATFSIEHPVQLPLLGTSMFPVQVCVESIDVQTRLKLVWDSSDHHTSTPSSAASFPDPSTRSLLELSLANVPDVSVKMKSEIGAWHKIVDSQVITSLLATLAKKWLVKKLIWPKKASFTFKLPPMSVPVGRDAKRPEEEDEATSEMSMRSSMGSSASSRGVPSDIDELQGSDGWTRGERAARRGTSPDELEMLRDHALGLARVSLLSAPALPSTPEPEEDTTSTPGTYTTIRGEARYASPFK